MFLNFVYLFMAVLGLCCYAGFSLSMESWSYSLGCVGSVAVVRGLSCSMACGVFMDLPGSGIEPVPPAWAGRFFTPEPPGKPNGVLFFLCFFSSTTLLLSTHLPPPSCSHAQSCNPMDFRLPDSSVHGLF
ncbi:unnamed protein product [Rangifer tarandus platyrhynchus]|uniref:Secreted protein n=2 Tax=Rangifer tarandus platyrhynchus TaxID=3082113 RepID=A0ABN8YNR2_RANTA|nr:unnamed protein product [Rangifer tarandus platyrhynchus]